MWLYIDIAHIKINENIYQMQTHLLFSLFKENRLKPHCICCMYIYRTIYISVRDPSLYMGSLAHKKNPYQHHPHHACYQLCDVWCVCALGMQTNVVRSTIIHKHAAFDVFEHVFYNLTYNKSAWKCVRARFTNTQNICVFFFDGLQLVHQRARRQQKPNTNLAPPSINRNLPTNPDTARELKTHHS